MSQKIVETSNEYLDLLGEFMRDETVIDSKNKTMNLIFSSFEAFSALHEKLAEATETISNNSNVHELELLQAEIKLIRTTTEFAIAKRIKPKFNGAQKNIKTRSIAYEFIRKHLNENPSLSIRRLAALLEADSTANIEHYGKLIPLGTAMGYARTIKKGG